MMPEKHIFNFYNEVWIQVVLFIYLFLFEPQNILTTMDQQMPHCLPPPASKQANI